MTLADLQSTLIALTAGWALSVIVLAFIIARLEKRVRDLEGKT